jgi:hypothetical protein
MVFLPKKKPAASLADGGVKKEFPRFRSLLEPQFPLGNPLFHPSVRAASCNFDKVLKNCFSGSSKISTSAKQW